MDKILEVKRLKISFRTNNGTVKAVRDISFDLERGKTLAIVGESGSGKSVTSKAVMGILAGNSIIDGGEILYDGRDLLKVTEEEMCTIRGDKIAMIFQDPLSSLNPIVKIGKQITEAMLLKNKTNRRTSRKQFNNLLKLMQRNMDEATEHKSTAQIARLCKTFDTFCIKANRLENSYNQSEAHAEELMEQVEDFLFKAEKQQELNTKAQMKDFLNSLKYIKDPFLVAKFGDRIEAVRSELSTARSIVSMHDTAVPEQAMAVLTDLKTLLSEMISQERPNFFRIGYYSFCNPSEDLATGNYTELNEMALRYLDENFMDEFLKLLEKGIRNSFDNALEKKRALLPALAEAKTYYSGDFTKSEALKYAKNLTKQITESIDLLETKKDNMAYTFGTAITSAINTYFAGAAKNPKEEKRFARENAKREKKIAAGKKIDWRVEPQQIFDLDELKADIVSIITRMEKHYEEYIEQAKQLDFHARCIELIDFLKEKASAVVYRLTKIMAKQKAIRLMDEVGISDPRARYYQYPFEFSGGMRQRIVIAIALAANPDILICDEPTTALDVTIQAQILELINNLKRERNLSVIFITHDLGVVANMADDIAVMYAGKIVEYGTAEDIFYDPRHPYTWALLSSMPDLDTKERLEAIPGTPPNMIYPPEGDAFAARNKYAMQIDFEQQPPMFGISDTHAAATWLLHPDAPKVDIPKNITDRIERMKKKHGGEQNG